MANERASVRVPHDAYVFVGDGRKALFLRNEGSPMAPRLRTMRVLVNDNPPTRELGTDKPGRSFSRMAPRRSAMEQTDWHEIGEERFTREVAGALGELARRDGAAAFVIVAPPRSLAVLRDALPAHVHERVVCEIDKDYAGQPIPEIEKQLAM
jgi:protein required for attachment to host cells